MSRLIKQIFWKKPLALRGSRKEVIKDGHGKTMKKLKKQILIKNPFHFFRPFREHFLIK